MPVRARSRSTHCIASTGAICLVAALFAAVASASRSNDATTTTPASASKGVALIRPFACNGKALAQGSGFLVGSSVVMTTRHALIGACRVRVTVNGKTATSTQWINWFDKQTSEAATDLATIKLDRAVTGAFLFAIGTAAPPRGTRLATLGFPRGATLRRAQGAIVWQGRVKGAPLLAVRIPTSSGADGAPLLDSSGNVVGVVRRGVGPHGLAGQRRPGEIGGLDLARWWGGDAVPDLCRSYPKGGIPNCPVDRPEPEPTPTAPSTPDQPDEPVPSDPSAPPRAPTDFTIKACWTQYTADSWDNVALTNAAGSFTATELKARGPKTYWSIVQLTEGAPAAIKGVTASLVSPTGFVSPGTPFEWSEDADRASETLAWTLTALGVWFFENPTYPLPSQWRIRWAFPNGQACDTPFLVT